MFIRKIPWTNRPSPASKISRSHPIGSSIYAAYFAANDNTIVDAVAGRRPVSGNYDITSWEGDGPAFTDQSSSLRTVFPTNITTINGKGAVTWYFRALTGSTVSDQMWHWPGSSGSNASLDNSGALALRINTRTRTFTTFATDLKDGKGHWITSNYWQGSGNHPQTLYIDGKLEETENIELFGSPIAQTEIYFGGGAGSFSAKGVVAAHYIHDRNLTSSEILSLHANPWQVFEPRTQIIPIEFITPSTAVNSIFSDRFGAAQSDLSGLSWAWFDEDVGVFNAPTAQGAIETSDSGGVSSIDTTGTTLTAGQTGTLVLYDSTSEKFGAYRAIIGANGSIRLDSPASGTSFYFDTQAGTIGVTSTPPLGPLR